MKNYGSFFKTQGGKKKTQKKGGIAVYMDTETSVSRDFLEAIGVDVSKLLYLHFECVEDIFDDKVENSSAKE